MLGFTGNSAFGLSKKRLPQCLLSFQGSSPWFAQLADHLRGAAVLPPCLNLISIMTCALLEHSKGTSVLVLFWFVPYAAPSCILDKHGRPRSCPFFQGSGNPLAAYSDAELVASRGDLHLWPLMITTLKGGHLRIQTSQNSRIQTSDRRRSASDDFHLKHFHLV